MTLFDDGDKLQKWLYRVKGIQLIIPGKYITEIPTERMCSFTVYDNYEKHIFPIFKIEIILESSLYYKIIKHKDNVRFYLRIQKYYHYSDKTTKSLMRDYINDRFDIILDDNDEDMMAVTKREKASKNYKQVKESDENELDMVDNKMEFFLFNHKALRGSKKNINHVLVNATVLDAVALCFHTAGLNNVLMSPVNNHKSYKELFIPPLTCNGAIQFIDTYYGIHKAGSILYYGFDYTYMLADTGKCTAWVKSEITTTQIIIPAKTSKHTTEPGILEKEKPDKMNHLIADYTTLSIRNDSISRDFLSANEGKFVDNYEGSQTVEKSKAVTKEGKNNRNDFEDKTENKYLSKIYASQTASESVVLSVKIMDFDLSVIQPNKRFLVVFEDTALAKKYKGEYSLVSVANTFIKEGKDFALTSTLTLKKT